MERIPYELLKCSNEMAVLLAFIAIITMIAIFTFLFWYTRKIKKMMKDINEFLKLNREDKNET